MSVIDVKVRYEFSLLAIPGIVGVAADVNKNEIVVYVENKNVCLRVPSSIEGYKVRCVVTGEFRVL